DDFRRFLDCAHEHGIRLVTDMVLNHTSDQHPWFRDSRSSRDDPKRDWYLWRDGRGDGPPNNWISQFGGAAWQPDEATGQFYYHCCLPDQPDLNWRNPQVRAEMWDVMRFWLGMGVDGFRLDSIGNLFKAEHLPDHDVTHSIVELRYAWLTATSAEERQPVGSELGRLFRDQVDQPEIHELMRELRSVVDEFPECVLIGETDQV